MELVALLLFLKLMFHDFPFLFSQYEYLRLFDLNFKGHASCGSGVKGQKLPTDICIDVW